MKYERYTHLSISPEALEFTFISIGPKGEIKKLVQFIQTNNADIYNLAFGDLLDDGSVDDHIKNDNQDRNKILATVASIVYEFTSFYPEKWVFFAGSTNERTRLYRMAISNNFDELIIDFELFGVIVNNENYYTEPFEKGKDYYGFLVKRKKM